MTSAAETCSPEALVSSIRGTSFPPFWRREKPVEDTGPRRADVESIATAHPPGSAPFLLGEPARNYGLGRVDGADVFELDLLALLVVLLVDVHLPEVVLRPEDVAGGQHGG